MNYAATLVPDSPWSRLSASTRKLVVRGMFAVTEAGLIAGLYDKTYWEWVVWFSIAHAILALSVVGWRPMVFPAQIRIAYVLWVAIGTFVPYMSWMMYVTLVGLGANLLAGYCPMSRMIYLLPWNREEPFDVMLPLRTFFSKPVPGRFHAPARAS